MRITEKELEDKVRSVEEITGVSLRTDYAYGRVRIVERLDGGGTQNITDFDTQKNTWNLIHRWCAGFCRAKREREDRTAFCISFSMSDIRDMEDADSRYPFEDFTPEQCKEVGRRAEKDLDGIMPVLWNMLAHHAGEVARAK